LFLAFLLPYWKTPNTIHAYSIRLRLGEIAMSAARRYPRNTAPIPSPVRRRVEPKSLALLVDVVLARYGIVPLEAQRPAEPARKPTVARRGEQTLLFPLT
jgi:hypothetical protein